MTSIPLLRIADLRIAFKLHDKLNYVVNDLNLKIEQGQTLALVGESGSGKSITALSILRLLNADNIVYPQGKILFQQQNLLEASEQQLEKIRGNQISMIFQEPMVSLNPLHSIEKQLTEVLVLHKKQTLASARSEVITCLERVGIRQAKQRLTSYPHQLSGGERQRVIIAMAILTKPKLLIADEPTTALDVMVQAQILSLLAELKQELNMGLLFITHNLNIVRKLADDIAVMQQGYCVEQGSKQQIFSAPHHAYTQHLLASELTEQATDFNHNNPTILRVDNLAVSVPLKQRIFQRISQQKPLLTQINFTLKQGETLGIVGESGSGKTTLTLALLRLIKSRGQINFAGQFIDQFNNKQMLTIRRKLQIVFQDPFSALNPRLTVAQIIAEGLKVQQKLPAQDVEAKVIAIMQEVGLDPLSRQRYPAEFSGGQRQRIAIARALILQPDLLILDEPTSSLDNSVQAQILNLLSQLQQRHNLSYILISHDLQVIRRLCHQVLVLKQGQIIEQGSCQQIFSAPQTDYTQQLIAFSL